MPAAHSRRLAAVQGALASTGPATSTPLAAAPAGAATRQQWVNAAWKQLPAEYPVTQAHVLDPTLTLSLHGPAAALIKKSNHPEEEDDPWYIWSGMCTEGRWGLSLRPPAEADLRGGLVCARTRNAGASPPHSPPRAA